MPFESDLATTFLTNVRKILEFQSTVDFLKCEQHRGHMCILI